METISKNYQKNAYSFVFGISDTLKAVDMNRYVLGEVVKMVVVLPNWTNTVTAQVQAFNGDSKEIFESSALAQNAEYDITLDRNECIILGDSDEEFKIKLSGAPGGSGGTATLTVYVEA